MVLAAGRGERLRPVTDSLPKALVEVGGQTLLERHLRLLADIGVSHVVINLDWLGEQIVERIGDGRHYGVSVIYSPEFGDVLETAGGIRRALPMLGDDPFLVVNADIYTDALVALADLRLHAQDLGHLVLVPTPVFKQQGDFALDKARVRNDGEPRYTFSGIALYRPALFATLKPGRAPLAPLLRQAADEDRLSGIVYPGNWEDVGTPQRLQDVRNRVAGGDSSVAASTRTGRAAKPSSSSR